jgi:precorrin-2 C20-methyltransferase/precorrin-3B C17-methyltransferase
VAARAGAPLGGDYAVLSLSDRLRPWALIEDRLRAVAAADLVLAVYNPASRTRTSQVKQAKEILLEYRAAETPVVVGRNVGRDSESLVVTPLGDLDPDTIDMSCLLIVGSSATIAQASSVYTLRAGSRTMVQNVGNPGRDTFSPTANPSRE